MFNIGDKVFHTSKGKYGIIVPCSDKDDNRFYNGYEYCYYVAHSNYIWSVSESFLREVGSKVS